MYNGSDTEWQQWDWDRLTTVVTTAHCPDKYCDYPISPVMPVAEQHVDKALLCHAHQRGVRVVSFTFWTGATDVKGQDKGRPKDGQLANATARKEWVDWEVATAVRLGLDGVNIDIEGQMNATLRQPLTSLTCELRAALQAAIPNASVSFDLAIEPAYGPIAVGYDYLGLSRCVDTVVPMAYDMIASGRVNGAANSPLPGVLHGIAEYKHLGVPLRKLNVALPWYGYDYVCDSLTPGANCTAPPGFPNRQLGLGQILDLRQAAGLPTVQFDRVSVSKRFEYFGMGPNNTRQRRRVTYDDEETLAIKYASVLRQGVGGIGLWTADATHRDQPNDSARTAAAMWSAVANATDSPPHH